MGYIKILDEKVSNIIGTPIIAPIIVSEIIPPCIIKIIPIILCITDIQLIECELLPLLEAGASWEVSAFVNQIYLPSSSGSSYPVFFYFLIFQHCFSNVFYIQCRIVISINFNPTALTFITSF